MKKFLLSFVVVVASAAYVVYQYAGGSNTTSATTTASNTTITIPVPTTYPATSTTPTQAPATTTKPRGQYADGTYTGNSVDAYYGYVKVQATVQGGKLADVAFLQHPHNQSTSQYINEQAMPMLRQEALRAQSSNVSGVSGASYTSAAFRKSLSSALAQAKN